MLLSLNDITRMIDISCVRSENSYSEIKAMVDFAKQYKFICAHTLPANIPYMKELLDGNEDVMMGCPIGFPAGGNDVTVKIYELERCIELGVEIDVVMNIGWIISGLYRKAEDELAEIIKHSGNTKIKTIIETPLLTEKMIETASKIALNAGAAFVKTSTGWANKPTTLRHIEIIKNAIGDNMEIKASGGIRGLKMLLKMYKMGVSRFGIGTKHAMDLVKEIKKCPNGVEV